MSERNQYTIHGRLFELPPRYEFHKAADHDGGRSVGFATYGAVCESYDRQLGLKVMMKKLEGLHGHTHEKFARFVKELRLLSRLNHYGVVKILDCFCNARDTPKDTVKDIYISIPSYDSNLLHIIRSEQVLTRQHVRLIAFQLLEAVRYLHEHRILATRLCPANILCNVNCSLCIGELGAAIPMPIEGGTPNTYFLDPDPDERSEPWYSAPELLLNAPVINYACDIWSVGVIIGELLCRKPLFPGKDRIDQLTNITDTLGIERKGCAGTSVSHSEMIEAAQGKFRFLGTGKDAETARHFLLSMGPKLPVPLRTVLPTGDRFVIDLLERMVTFCPEGRGTAESLLGHPYFDDHIPREVIIKKEADEELGADLNGTLLVRVKPDSPADLCGLSQFIGFRLTHVNKVSLTSGFDHSVLSGKGTVQLILRFGNVEVNCLENVDWNTKCMSQASLQASLREEVSRLQTSY